MAAGIEVTVCNRMSELAPLWDEWRTLAVTAGSIFVTPEWAGAWFDAYGKDYEPSIRCVTHNGRLVALMPLMTDARGTLRFVGDGAGDIFAPLVAADHPPRTLDTLLGTLRTHPGTLLVLTNVERSASWRCGLKGGLGHAALVDRETVLPYIDLRGLDWQGFLSSRSANFRSQLGRKNRALGRAHEVQMRLLESPSELATDLEQLFVLHDKRWEPRGGSGSSSPRMRAFLTTFCARALDQGWLRLWTLELDGQPAAAWLGWRVGNRYAYYLAGFDPRHAHRSPGLLLLARTVEAAIAENAAEYDLLLGDEDYKSRFANGFREVETEILGHRWSSRLLLARTERMFRRAGRRLPATARTRLQSAAHNLVRPLPLGRHR